MLNLAAEEKTKIRQDVIKTKFRSSIFDGSVGFFFGQSTTSVLKVARTFQPNPRLSKVLSVSFSFSMQEESHFCLSSVSFLRRFPNRPAREEG